MGVASANGIYLHSELTQGIIGAAIEVHKELGRGFLEKVYEGALVVELRARGVSVTRQAPISVAYKGTPVGLYFADLFVDDKVICEIKVTDSLSGAHEAQLLNYLKATGMRVGLLLNFGRSRIEVKRLIF